jgi:hypothetical protein
VSDLDEVVRRVGAERYEHNEFEGGITFFFADGTTAQTWAHKMEITEEDRQDEHNVRLRAIVHHQRIPTDNPQLADTFAFLHEFWGSRPRMHHLMADTIVVPVWDQDFAEPPPMSKTSYVWIEFVDKGYGWEAFVNFSCGGPVAIAESLKEASELAHAKMVETMRKLASLPRDAKPR